jgi:hypothetical protein
MPMAALKNSKTLGAPSLRIVPGVKSARQNRHTETKAAGPRPTERARRRGDRIKDAFAAVHESGIGTTGRFAAVQQVVRY